MIFGIIDYNAGNLRNVQKAFQEFNVEVIIVKSPSELPNLDAYILPGVGSFFSGMSSLKSLNLDQAIRHEVLANNKPILGICLGMHLFAESGDEGGKIEGLGLVDMNVKKFNLTDHRDRLPHVGWNSINIINDQVLYKNIPNNADFYFAHSYISESHNKNLIASTTDYIHSFISSISSSNIFATQFHPEKSQRYGKILIKNFINFCNS